MPDFSLAYLTTAPMRAPDALVLAQELGYRHIGVRLTGVPGCDAAAMMDDPALLRETASRTRSTGICILDAELVRIDANYSAKAHLKLFDAAATLGARALLVIADDTNMVRLTDNFATLCTECASYDLNPTLEFMPGTAVPNPKTALRVLADANCSNGRILVDVLHVARSGATANELASIPARACRLHPDLRRAASAAVIGEGDAPRSTIRARAAGTRWPRPRRHDSGPAGSSDRRRNSER